MNKGELENVWGRALLASEGWAGLLAGVLRQRQVQEELLCM